MSIGVHKTAAYLLDPQHLVTVNLVGCGGTGSQVLTLLARLNVALREFGHPGLQVYAWDGDIVSDANIGRQLFSAAEIGLNKSVCLVSKINRFFGFSWEARAEHLTAENRQPANITISCIDSWAGRVELSKFIDIQNSNHIEPHFKPYYWLDFGNNAKTGQCVLGTIGYGRHDINQYNFLQTVIEMFGEHGVEEDYSTPSCSLADALAKQDLFINSTLANHGMQIIWELFRNRQTAKRGCYLNLETGHVKPILIGN